MGKGTKTIVQDPPAQPEEKQPPFDWDAWREEQRRMYEMMLRAQMGAMDKMGSLVDAQNKAAKEAELKRKEAEEKARLEKLRRIKLKATGRAGSIKTGGLGLLSDPEIFKTMLKAK